MLARLRERRLRKKEELETRLAVVDAVYGRLDGEDEAPPPFLSLDEMMQPEELTDQNGAVIDNGELVLQLDRLCNELLAIAQAQSTEISYLRGVAAATRALVELIQAQQAKTGERIFHTKFDDTDPIVGTLNHRFSDLVSLLHNQERPVPPKLAQGTVH